MNLTTEFINKVLISCDQRINKMEKDKETIACAGRIKYYENAIKLVQVEKLIYKALLKNNNAIFPRLLNKYDELMGLSYDMSGNMVLSGIYKEGEYLAYCNKSLEQREYISNVCVYGERR